MAPPRGVSRMGSTGGNGGDPVKGLIRSSPFGLLADHAARLLWSVTRCEHSALACRRCDLPSGMLWTRFSVGALQTLGFVVIVFGIKRRPIPIVSVVTCGHPVPSSRRQALKPSRMISRSVERACLTVQRPANAAPLRSNPTRHSPIQVSRQQR